MGKLKRATDRQLAAKSLLDAFETLRQEGATETDAIDRMMRIAAFNRYALAAIAAMAYRPFGDDGAA